MKYLITIFLLIPAYCFSQSQPPMDSTHYAQVKNVYPRSHTDSIMAVPIGMGTITGITANYTALLTDIYIPVNASSGNITVTLPTGSGIYYLNLLGKYVGKIYIIKKMDSSTNTVTVVGNIDGGTNMVFNTPMQAMKVQANSTTTYIRE